MDNQPLFPHDIIAYMLLSGLPFEKMWQKLHRGTLIAEAPIRFIKFIEQRLGAKFLYDTNSIPFGRTELVDLFELAAKLIEAKVIKSVSPAFSPSDEPSFRQWQVVCGTPDNHSAGGMAIDEDRNALIPALAEAVERYLWMTVTDYFESPRTATPKEIVKFDEAVLPESFVGWTKEQREQNPRLTLTEDSKFLWVKGYSYTKEKAIYVPAQTVSGVHRHDEQRILTQITTGLATGPTKEFALLNGALEILERDAFMITWLNQLTPKRIDIEKLAESDEELADLLKMCARYRLKPNSILMPTDAPAYAVCSVVEDLTEHGPHVSIGLKAHRSLISAIKGSCLEALRIRQTIRYRDHNTPLDPAKPGSDIVHLERAQYWGVPGSARKLDFLVAGAVHDIEPQDWDNDTIEQHWERIVRWGKENGYEIAGVDVGRSKHNVSPWQIHMLVMPQMQPMHQTERLIYLGGDRLITIPKQFGYTPRPKPYQDEPHPFA